MHTNTFSFPSSIEKELKAPRSGCARIHGMTQVTPASIAYVSTQVGHPTIGQTCFVITKLLAGPLCIVLFTSFFTKMLDNDTPPTDSFLFKHDRLYKHSLVRVNYTRCNVRRSGRCQRHIKILWSLLAPTAARAQPKTDSSMPECQISITLMWCMLAVRFLGL